MDWDWGEGLLHYTVSVQRFPYEFDPKRDGTWGLDLSSLIIGAHVNMTLLKVMYLVTYSDGRTYKHWT